MKNTREHPDNLPEMDTKEFIKYLRREAKAMDEQKQTAIARALNEAADRLEATLRG
jgi:hypothetical protein